MKEAVERLQTLLKEKLACYQQLNLVLNAEKKAIGNIDLTMIWDTTRAKKDLAGQIEALRDTIRVACQNHFPGMDKKMKGKTDSFSLGELVNALPVPNKCKIEIRQLKRTIDKEKDTLTHLIKSNQRQVEKHLSIVDNIMDVFGNNVFQARYTGKGLITQKKNCLFMAQV